MNYHLVCVNEFHGYKKGQMITDAAEIEELLNDREHHFVRINIPPASPVIDTPPVVAKSN